MGTVIRSKIRIIIIIIMTIVSMVVFSKMFMYWLYNRSILQARVNQITVDDLNNPLTLRNLREYKERWDISEDEIKDIEANPQKYKKVIIKVGMTNTSKYIGFYDGSLKVIYKPEFENLIIGKLHDTWIDPSLNCRANDNSGRSAFFIVKCNGKTNEQIRELAKKISFTITGKTYSESLIFSREGTSKNYCKSMD